MVRVALGGGKAPINGLCPYAQLRCNLFQSIKRNKKQAPHTVSNASFAHVFGFIPDSRPQTYPRDIFQVRREHETLIPTRRQTYGSFLYRSTEDVSNLRTGYIIYINHARLLFLNAILESK